MPAMDPYTAAFGAMGAMSTALQAPPAGPSQAKGGEVGGNVVDHSGWNITFGNDSAISATRSQETQNPASPIFQYALYAGAFLLAWKFLKKQA